MSDKPKMQWFQWSKKLECHPSNKYPPMTEEEKASIRADFKANGFDKHFPIMLLDEKVIDGWNRYLLAQEERVKFLACILPANTDPDDFSERANERRRHLKPEYLQQKRQERIERVAAARAEGKSTRTIAAEEGVSQSQVVADLKETAQVNTPCSPDTTGGTVTGADGKSYPATQPPKPPAPDIMDKFIPELRNVANGFVKHAVDMLVKADLDEAEQYSFLARYREGKSPQTALGEVLANRPVEDWEPAASANGKARGKKKDQPKEREPGDDSEQDEATDEEGHAITDASAAAFANREKFKELDSLVRQLQTGIDELSRLPGGEQLRRHLQPTGAEGKTINKSEHLNCLKRDLRFTRPHAICPWCQGKARTGCKGCSGTGWVTSVTWKNAEENIKAKVTA